MTVTQEQIQGSGVSEPSFDGVILKPPSAMDFQKYIQEDAFT